MKIYDSVLKPCPFCGNKTSVHAYTYKDAVYRQYAVKCNKCGARIMGASTELAIDKWNRRAEPERKKGEWIEKDVEDVEDYQIESWQSAKCSICGKYHTTPYLYYFGNYNYCPNCGADMRGENGQA